jgi:hypothetical protein
MFVRKRRSGFRTGACTCSARTSAAQPASLVPAGTDFYWKTWIRAVSINKVENLYSWVENRRNKADISRKIILRPIIHDRKAG